MSRSPATRARAAKKLRRDRRRRDRELERRFDAHHDLLAIIESAELVNGERVVMLTPAQAELARQAGYEFTPEADLRVTHVEANPLELDLEVIDPLEHIHDAASSR